MVDHTTGSFGHYNPMGNSFSNIGGMYMLGKDNLNQDMMPNISSMYGSGSQRYFNPYTVEPVSYGYQSPQVSMQSYGILDTIKHSIIGMPRPLGQSGQDIQVAKREYRHLAGVTAGYDAAGIAGGAAAGGLAAAAGAGFMMSMGVAAAVPLGMDYMHDLHMGNYKRTQQMGSMFSNMMSRGSVGISGSESAKITKLVDQVSSKDLMLSSDDMMNAMSSFKDSGMFADIGDSNGIISRFKELTKVLKTTSDILGSTDLKDAMAEIVKFRQLGFSVGTIGSSVNSVTMSGRFAGMSQQASMDNFNATVMAASSEGVDARLAFRDTVRSQYSMKAMQQSGFMSPMMNNTKVLSAANRELYVGMHRESGRMNALTDDQIAYYATTRAKDEPNMSAQEIIDELKGMSPGEKLSKVYGYKNSREYIFGMTDKDYRSSVLANTKGIEDLNIESNFSMVFNRYKKMIESGGEEATVEKMVTYMKEDYSPQAIEAMRGQIGMSLRHGVDYAEKIEKIGKRMEERKEMSIGASRYAEENSLFGTGKLFLKKVQKELRYLAGGYEGAGEMQDYARSVYGNYGVGEMGRRDMVSYEGYKMKNSEKLKLAASLVRAVNPKRIISEEEKKEIEIEEIKEKRIAEKKNTTALDKIRKTIGVEKEGESLSLKTVRTLVNNDSIGSSEAIKNIREVLTNERVEKGAVIGKNGLPKRLEKTKEHPYGTDVDGSSLINRWDRDFEINWWKQQSKIKAVKKAGGKSGIFKLGKLVEVDGRKLTKEESINAMEGTMAPIPILTEEQGDRLMMGAKSMIPKLSPVEKKAFSVLTPSELKEFDRIPLKKLKEFSKLSPSKLKSLSKIFSKSSEIDETYKDAMEDIEGNEEDLTKKKIETLIERNAAPSDAARRKKLEALSSISKLNKNRRLVDLDTIKGETTDTSMFSMGNGNFWADAWTMSPEIHSKKYKSKEDNWLGGISNAVEYVAAFGVSGVADIVQSGGNIFTRLFQEFTYDKSGDVKYLNSERANKNIHKQSAVMESVKINMSDMNKREKLETLILGETYAKKTPGVSQMKATQMASYFKMGLPNDKAYALAEEEIAREEEAGLDLKKEDKMTMKDVRIAFKSFRKGNKEVKKILDLKSDKEISEQMAEMENKDLKTIEKELARTIMTNPNASSDAIIGVVSENEKFMGAFARQSGETNLVSSTSKKSETDMGKIVMTQILATSGKKTSYADLAEMKVDEKYRSSGKKMLSVLHKSGSYDASKYKKLKEALINYNEGDKKTGVAVADAALAMTEDMSSSESSDFIKNVVDIQKLDKEHRPAVMEHGENSISESGKNLLDSMSTLTGLDNKKSAKLYDILSMDESDEKYQAFFDFRSRNRTDKMDSLSMQDLTSSVADSQVFHMSESGADLLEGGASDKQIMARNFDEFQKMNKTLTSMEEKMDKE